MPAGAMDEEGAPLVDQETQRRRQWRKRRNAVLNAAEHVMDCTFLWAFIIAPFACLLLGAMFGAAVWYLMIYVALALGAVFSAALLVYLVIACCT